MRDGDVPPGADPAVVAGFYDAVLQGIALRARDGATRDALRAVADAAVRAWDAVAR